MNLALFARRAALGATLLALGASAALAQTPSHDLLNATLWMQRSVEYKANSLAVFALAKMRLDQALADKNWTGAPDEQKGSYQDLPPAIVVDLDETAMDNSRFQAWMVMNDKVFTPKVWTEFCELERLRGNPGRARLPEICRREEREDFLRVQPHRGGRGRHAKKCGAPRLSRWAATSTRF